MTWGAFYVAMRRGATTRVSAVRSNLARPAQTQSRTAATKAMPKNNDNKVSSLYVNHEHCGNHVVKKTCTHDQTFPSLALSQRKTLDKVSGLVWRLGCRHYPSQLVFDEYCRYTFHFIWIMPRSFQYEYTCI